MNSTENVNTGTKICKKCGRILPVGEFRLVKGQFNNPYYLGQCKECEYKYQRAYLEKKNKIEFSDDLEIFTNRCYKEFNPKRILDIEVLNIVPVNDDEMFVKLMDYKNAWLSNYGRAIRYVDGEYKLLKGSCDMNGALRYSLRKNVFADGKWTYKSVHLYAAQAVVDEFVINPDKLNNIYIWHKRYDKHDYYYKNLYPLNQKQYKTVKNHFNKTGDDSENFIIKVMNDIRYKPDDWSRRAIRPVCVVLDIVGVKM